MNTNTNELKNYFTEEIKEKIREMSYEDQRNEFKSLEGTRTWIAILKYIQDRSAITQDSFLVLDPVKEPSKISQYQGVITGLWDLPDAVLTIKFEAKKAEDPKNKEEDDKNDLGGAYGKY